MSSEAEKNKAIVRRFLEETKAKGNLDAIDELAAPDFVDRSLMPGQGPTREGYKRSVARDARRFPYHRFTIEEQVAEGDTVVTKYRRAASFQESGWAPLLPGRRRPEEAIYIHRISGGKIVEEWGIVSSSATGVSRARDA